MSRSILIVIVIGLVAGVVQAGVFSNGGFEADSALVPNPGDTAAGPPTGWEYDRYYGYDVDPWLVNCSALGDGSGGNVGVKFGTWNGEIAWDPVMAQYPGIVTPGQYTLEIKVLSEGAASGGWLDVQLGWFEDPADPWGIYGEYVREWIDVSGTYGDGVWTTLTWTFEVTAGGAGDGLNWYLWLRGQSYDDYVIVGDVSLSVPGSHDPIDGATNVCRDAVLSWDLPSYVPATGGHRVYFSDDFSEVQGGTVGSAADRGLGDDPEFDTTSLPFTLARATTYYWRVDMFNPVGGWEEGDVWYFMTQGVTSVEGVTATADSNDADRGPEKTLDLVGNLHSSDQEDMWLSTAGAGAWIEYDLGQVYKLDKMLVWNHNTEFEGLLQFGVQEATITYSTDGVSYDTLGTTHNFSQAPGAAAYEANTTTDLEGIAAQYVRITVNSTFGGPKAGLSEVRFTYKTTQARAPYSPISGAIDQPLETILNWTPGVEAASHELYISTDFQEVADGSISPISIPASASCLASYATSLDMGKTYYWKVNEVNLANEPDTYEGEVWNFTTPEYVIVESFESYGDTLETAVFSTWVDGYNVGDNGSQIGYFTADPSYLEGAITYGGSWSAPFFFVNTGSAMKSEATRTFDSPQNWSIGGIRALTLFFYGQSSNSAPSAGEKMYVKVNGVKVAYDGDMANITKEQWHQWDIDLAAFGINLSSVTTISLGFDRGVSTASGMVFFDEIRLYSSRCVISRGQPAGDLNSDCRFDHLDIQILTNNWLVSSYEIDVTDPGTANLIGHWPLDEGFGATTADAAPAGYNNYGELVDGAAWTTGYGGGGAISFDGVDDYVVCAERTGVDPGTYPAELMPDTFTISCWAKVNTFSYYSSFVGNGMDYGYDECGFFFYNSGTSSNNFGLAIRTETAMDYVETPSIYETGTWYHLAATYDGQYASVYVNGALAAGPQDVGGPIRWINDQEGNTNYPERFTIGAWLDNVTDGYMLWVDGTIDEVRYYNTALSHGQIGWLAGETSSYVQPMHLLLTPNDPAINAYDGDAVPIIDWKDLAALAADKWLDQQYWPE